MFSSFLLLLFHQQAHDPGQNRTDNRKSCRPHKPFAEFVFLVDVRFHILGTGDLPGFRVSDPVLVDQQPVDQIHDREDREHLPEAFKETSGSIDGIRAHEDRGKVYRDTQTLKKLTVLPIFSDVSTPHLRSEKDMLSPYCLAMSLSIGCTLDFRTSRSACISLNVLDTNILFILTFLNQV